MTDYTITNPELNLDAMFRDLAHNTTVDDRVAISRFEHDVTAQDVDLMWRAFLATDTIVANKYGRNVCTTVAPATANMMARSGMMTTFRRFVIEDDGPPHILCVIGAQFEYHIYRNRPEYGAGDELFVQVATNGPGVREVALECFRPHSTTDDPCVLLMSFIHSRA